MKYIKGHNRSQAHLFPVSLEESIDPGNEVRIIDVFVDSLPLKDYGFRVDFNENGRPAYHPADLLKLYIYGYINKTRSARDLEKETKRNIEVMWLLKCLQPDHNTISNFRRDNPKAINKVFRATVQIAKNFDLIGGKLIAGDSSKFRAQNSKKNNYNRAKIERHIDYIDKKLEEYNSMLVENDNINNKKVSQEIEKHKERKQKYNELQKQLDETKQAQISTSDPESRQMIVRNNITEVAYNVQTTIDQKHCLAIDYKVTNNNDSKAMGNMLRRAKSILRKNDFTALYDKGYHTGSEFKIAQEIGVEAIVAVPALPSSSQAPHQDFNVSEFVYNKEMDYYTCPNNETLTSNGKWYSKKRGSSLMSKHYKTKACKSCKSLSLCTGNSRNRARVIERGQHADYIENNKKTYENNQEIYKRRQAIAEHPFGTIKRQWGFSYITTKKTINRASADVGLMFIAYNLRRLVNIIGKEAFASFLASLFAFFPQYFQNLRRILSHFYSFLLFQKFNFQISKLF